MSSLPPKTLENYNDPFSHLPDCIIHRIISFLDDEDFICLLSVSKRFMNVCLTSPYLSFVSKTCSEYSRPTDNYCRKLHKFLVKFLRDRDASLGIIRIRIECTCYTCKFIRTTRCLAEWIHEAAKHNVQELDLKLRFSLSMSMLSFKSLTVLKLSCDYYFYSGVVFPSVQILSLDGRGYEDDETGPIMFDYHYDRLNRMNENDKPRIGLFEWISNSFPSLKKLSLARVAEKIIFFKSSTIEDLTLRVSHEHDDKIYSISILMENLESFTLELLRSLYHYQVENNIVRITAPNLRYFKLKSSCRHSDFQAEFLHLRKACFDVQSDSNYLVALHRSITLAPSLELDLLAFERFSKDDDCIRIMGENLQYLIVNVDENYSKNDEYIQLIISYLKLFHNMKSITIKHKNKNGDYQTSDDEKYTGNMKLDERKNLKLFRSLKEVVMEIRTGTKEIELVKYLLKYAESLEKVTVFYASDLSNMMSCIDFQSFEITSMSLELFVELSNGNFLGRKKFKSNKYRRYH